jgi:hypothetical protein
MRARHGSAVPSRQHRFSCACAASVSAHMHACKCNARSLRPQSVSSVSQRRKEATATRVFARARRVQRACSAALRIARSVQRGRCSLRLPSCASVCVRAFVCVRVCTRRGARACAPPPGLRASATARRRSACAPTARQAAALRPARARAPVRTPFLAAAPPRAPRPQAVPLTAAAARRCRCRPPA